MRDSEVESRREAWWLLASTGIDRGICRWQGRGLAFHDDIDAADPQTDLEEVTEDLWLFWKI